MLLSGGVDSFACAHFLCQQKFTPLAVFVDYGQAARAQELAATSRVCEFLGIQRTVIQLSTSPIHRFGSGETPVRNLALLSLATLYTLGGRVVAMGIHAGTPYFDCSPSFTEQAGRLINECTNGVVAVFAPFLRWTKRDVIEYAQSEGLDLDLTYSCEAGTLPPCGTCSSCRDRSALLC